MKIVLNTREEIQISPEETELLTEALLAGIEFLQIGNRVINSRFIIGIFESGPEMGQRMLETPEFEPVGNNQGMKRLFGILKEKGFFKEYNSYEDWQRKFKSPEI